MYNREPEDPMRTRIVIWLIGMAVALGACPQD